MLQKVYPERQKEFKGDDADLLTEVLAERATLSESTIDISNMK